MTKLASKIGNTIDKTLHFNTCTIYDAAKTNDIELIKIRLAAGVDPLEKPDTTYPIEIAAEKGYLDIVKLLHIPSKTNVDAIKAAAKSAIANKHFGIASFLENTPLHFAVEKLDVAEVKALATEDSVKVTNLNDLTPLALLIKKLPYTDKESDALEILRHLLAYRPTLDDIQEALIALLKKDKCFPAVRLLLEAWKTRENSTNHMLYNEYLDKYFPWYGSLLFLTLGRSQVIEKLALLHECGADLAYQEDKESRSLLEIAIHNLINGYKVEQFTKVITFLLQKKVNVNCVDHDDGDSPIHTAVRAGNLKLVKLLVEHGADTNCVNEKGETPITLAEKSNFMDISAFLSNPVAPIEKLSIKEEVVDVETTETSSVSDNAYLLFNSSLPNAPEQTRTVGSDDKITNRETAEETSFTDSKYGIFNPKKRKGSFCKQPEDTQSVDRYTKPKEDEASPWKLCWIS